MSSERKPITRRTFLRSAAATAATTSAMAAAANGASSAMAGAGAQRSPGRGADRRAAQADAGTSSTVIYAATEHASGIPLGGIGTGSIEVRPDGHFHDWLIFNQGSWAPHQPDHEQNAGPDLGPGALAFYLRTQQTGSEPQVRRLGLRSDQNDLYSQGAIRNVEAIAYDGRFPTATLKYLDDTLPVTVTGLYFSAFTPHDARTSGTPGFHAVFNVRNTSSKPVEVSLMGTLDNPLAWTEADRKLTNSISKDGATTFLTMRTAADSPHKATLGSIGLSVTGGEPSWILGAFPAYLSNGFNSPGPLGGMAVSFLQGFREAGRLPSLPGATSPAHLLDLSDEEIGRLSLTEKQAKWKQLTDYAVFDEMRRRVERVDPSQLTTDDGLATVLRAARSWMGRFAGRDRRDTWGDAALCSTVTLAPGEEKEVRYTLGWYFPHHFSADGPEMGHKYEEWFQDAEQVNWYLAANAERQQRDALTFAGTLHDTSLGDEMASAWSAQLSTLVKCTWWTRDGKFAVWEGLGCCGFHTMDITYQGSFNILALFPELQKGQMIMGADFQRQDGRVAHFFTPDLFHVDNGFDRVDMNPQFVMLAARDYLWTGDKEYLRKLWPHIRSAMVSTALLDGDGDGLPDHDTRRNTYDAWDFSGTPAYIASLWLGALRSAERIAMDLGETADAEQFRSISEKANASFDRMLWNGEYYSLLVDGERRDEACMSDQLSGEWFTHLIGLGHGLPKERITAALEAIVRHNFSPEQGLLNASYPAGRKAHFPTYGNFQATANWTGIEYAIASMMIDFGLTEPGKDVVRSVHDRYRRGGRVWNHVECGNHYYRAMSSWALLLASTGFKVDAPNGALTVAPPSGKRLLRAPWFTSTAWGSLVFASPRRFEMHCASGEMPVRTLRLPAGNWKPRWNGKAIAANARTEDGLAVLQFAEPLVISAGGTLTASA